MKALLIYWIAGCFVAGIGLGKYIERCPRDDVPMGDIVMVVTTWPAFFFAAFTAPSNMPKSACKVASNDGAGRG